MGIEDEDYIVSKQNRRTSQDRQVERQVHNMFKTVDHTTDRNSLERKRHELERKAAKRKH